MRQLMRRVCHAIDRLRRDRQGSSSSEFWDQLYSSGGTSGRGSYGRLAEFKAEIINEFVNEHGIKTVVELGCGDGNQLKLATYPQYLGLDVSPTAVEHCRNRFLRDPTKSFDTLLPGAPMTWGPQDLALSLDVIYHLLEDEVFDDYMRKLFDSASRFVIIYSSDDESPSEWWEVRQRRFTSWIEREAPNWNLYKRIPQRYPTTISDPDTSWSDFFIYQPTAD